MPLTGTAVDYVTDECLKQEFTSVGNASENVFFLAQARKGGMSEEGEQWNESPLGNVLDKRSNYPNTKFGIFLTCFWPRDFDNERRQRLFPPGGWQIRLGLILNRHKWLKLGWRLFSWMELSKSLANNNLPREVSISSTSHTSTPTRLLLRLTVVALSTKCHNTKMHAVSSYSNWQFLCDRPVHTYAQSTVQDNLHN